MIRTIAVPSGLDELSRHAQQHALRLAGEVGARLRVVSIHEHAAGDHAPGPEEAGSAETPDVEELLEAAKSAGVRADHSYRGEARVEALAAEANECDLLVFGMPPEAESKLDDLRAGYFDDGVRLIRRANSSLLAVSSAPRDIERILTIAEDGPPCKMALRMAGFLAEALRARLTVFGAGRETGEADIHAYAAGEYLRGYDIPEISIQERLGVAESEAEVARLADAAGVDLIVLGAQPYKWFERLHGVSMEEGTARIQHRPVLIAR